jgi:acetolactate decarboxylase
MTKQYQTRFGALAWVLALGCGAPHDAVRPTPPPRAALYQYSVMDSLLAGVFDGDLTIGALKQHGDFGLGTFNQLDGEMVVHGGVVYRVRGDGSVTVAGDGDRSPNAFVTWFRPAEAIALDGAVSMAELKAELARRLRPNRAYAIELRGRFATITTRAPEAATQPYPELTAQLAAHAHAFALANTEGVAVGFVLPAYVARVSVPGLHLHYLAADHASGGHVLDLHAEPGVTVRIMELDGLDVEFSANPQFDQADLTRDRQRELQEAETGAKR